MKIQFQAGKSVDGKNNFACEISEISHLLNFSKDKNFISEPSVKCLFKFNLQNLQNVVFRLKNY